MPSPSTIGTYGGPYVDEETVENPESQISADKANRFMEDVAGLTITGLRAIARFIANASGNPPPADVGIWSVWGSGAGQKPTVTRDGSAGLYTLTFPTPQLDGLGVSESLVFTDGTVSIKTGTNNNDTGSVRSIASNVVAIKVFSAGVLSDFSGTGVVTVWLR